MKILWPWKIAVVDTTYSKLLSYMCVMCMMNSKMSCTHCRRFPLLTMNHGRVIATIRAMSAVRAGDADLVTLVLLPELVVVIDCKESFQQQAFALSEIDCHKYDEMDSVYLRLYLTGDQSNRNAAAKVHAKPYDLLKQVMLL